MYTSKQANEKKKWHSNLTYPQQNGEVLGSILPPLAMVVPRFMMMATAADHVVGHLMYCGPDHIKWMQHMHRFDEDCVLPEWKHTSNRRVVMAKPLDFLHPQFDDSTQDMDQGCHQGPDPHLSPCGLGEGHGPHCIQLMLAHTPSQRVHDNPCHGFQQVRVGLPPL